jgi:alpha-beta hydrolase superfamily lysophospholipase
MTVVERSAIGPVAHESGAGSADPGYIGTGAEAAFAMYHRVPAVTRSRTAVVLTPPWGWDDVSSYRTRRTWAETLAAAGHPTLRLDLPGTGDAGGGESDPGRYAAAVRAVAEACAWLRAVSGCDRVAVIGLGLGGLVAASAIAAGAPIDDLVLWGVPTRGRGLIRQFRAFAGLQGSRYSLTGEPEPSALPDGWLEVNGFVLSAETIAAIEAVSLGDLSARGLARALVLDQDGIPADPAIAAHLAAAGAEVSQRAGPGWGAMTFHPERPAVPHEVIDTILDWLAEPQDRIAPLRPSTPAVHASTDLDHTIDGVVVRETPIVVEGPVGRLFGILTRPLNIGGAPLGGVFLNAGAVRRIGPNRIFVDTARRWAAHGVASIRLDLEGIGDSDGDEERYRDVAQFYVNDEFGDQIRGAIDALVRRGHGPRIVLAGLCAGGFWAFRGAALDPRVRAAFLLNPGALEWRTELVEERQAARLHHLRYAATWRKLLRGGVPVSRVRATAGAAARQAGKAASRLPARAMGRRAPVAADAPSSADAILDRLAATGTTVVMAFSADEPLYLELERDGFLARAYRWPTLRLERLPGRDHTLRPIVAQQAARAMLDRELERELGRISAAPPARSA